MIIGVWGSSGTLDQSFLIVTVVLETGSEEFGLGGLKVTGLEVFYAT